MIAALDWPTLLWLALAAVVVGFSKTAVAGFGPVATVMFTAAMSAKEATGAVLVLLIACDVVAVTAYRRSCDWRLVRVLVPTLVPGIALGALFVRLVDDEVLRRTIGVLLLAMGLVQLAQTLRAGRTGGPAAEATRPVTGHDDDAAAGRPHVAVTAVVGSAAGFTTMAANAAGPVMSLYLLALRVPKLVFVGTSAWFYFVANLVKLPFAVAIGTVHAGSLPLNLVLVLPALAGCGLGLWALPRLPQAFFDRLALAMAIVSSLLLLR